MVTPEKLYFGSYNPNIYEKIKFLNLFFLENTILVLKILRYIVYQVYQFLSYGIFYIKKVF